jgi:hypothetical protein
MYKGFGVIKQEADLEYRDTFYKKSSNADWYINEKKKYT